MARNVRISTVTVNPLPEADYNTKRPYYDSVIESLDRLLKKVLRDKPDLIVLPEHSGRQTSLISRKKEYIEGESLRIYEFYKKVAKENNCYIAFSRYKKMADGTARNCVSMVNRQGEVIGEYHKNYPTPYESDSGILAGKDVPVFKCDFGTVCPIVCFDLNFEEIRKEIKEKNPDLITFHSAFHGGFMQEFFAYDTRSYLVSSLLSYKPSKILSPLGVTVATTTNYTPYVTARVNLDYAVCHIDYNGAKFDAAKEKYGSLLTIEDPGYVGAVLLTYEGEDKTVMDIVKEFDIELLDEYMERSIKNRKDNMEK